MKSITKKKKTDMVCHHTINMYDILRLTYSEFADMAKNDEKTRVCYIPSSVRMVEAPKDLNDLSEYNKRVGIR